MRMQPFDPSGPSSHSRPPPETTHDFTMVSLFIYLFIYFIGSWFCLKINSSILISDHNVKY
ncbi:hypothetical protein PO909_029315 [Leuciscus waleckii]